MGLFGGSSQSTSSVVSSIDFSPVIQFGEDQDATQDKVNRQEATTSPKLDDSLGLSASVGVLGGTGGPAQTSRYQAEDTPAKSNLANTALLSSRDKQNLTYLGFAVVGVTGVYFLIKASKSKKKK